MNRTVNILVLATLSTACQGQKKAIDPAPNMTLLPYPEAKKELVVDNHFGTEVPDPYRWLENDTAADTEAWVNAENKVTNHYLAQIPFRDAIYKRLEKLWNYEK